MAPRSIFVCLALALFAALAAVKPAAAQAAAVHWNKALAGHSFATPVARRSSFGRSGFRGGHGGRRTAPFRRPWRARRARKPSRVPPAAQHRYPPRGRRPARAGRHIGTRPLWRAQPGRRKRICCYQHRAAPPGRRWLAQSGWNQFELSLAQAWRRRPALSPAQSRWRWPPLSSAVKRQRSFRLRRKSAAPSRAGSRHNRRRRQRDPWTWRQEPRAGRAQLHRRAGAECSPVRRLASRWQAAPGTRASRRSDRRSAGQPQASARKRL